MKTDKTIFFFVRGILGHPSDQQEWEYRAADYIHLLTPHKARAISYATTPLRVWIRREWRAQRFARVLRKYTAQDWKVHIIAHSEGTVVTTDAIKLAGYPKIETIHLVCGACDANFERNGLNHAMFTGNLRRVFCYRAGHDLAMRIEDLIVGKLLFGIRFKDKPLGLAGPNTIRQSVSDRIEEIPWPDYGHGTAFEKYKFEQTMRLFLTNIYG